MELDITKIVKAYENGQSINSIAQDYDTYPTTIHRILNKHTILRHDSKKRGEIYLTDGDKLIEWAKKQGRLVTKNELASFLGKKRLSPKYFEKYPELGKYIKTSTQKNLYEYTKKLYDWLNKNNIPFKPSDRTKLKIAVDALLLQEYSNIALHIAEKPVNVSHNEHNKTLLLKIKRAEENNVKLILLNKEHFENLDAIKILLDTMNVLR